MHSVLLSLQSNSPYYFPNWKLWLIMARENEELGEKTTERGLHQGLYLGVSREWIQAPLSVAKH